MSRDSNIFAALAAGAVAGALILGLGGRGLMAALVLLAGDQPSFSWGGTAEVVAVGLAYGALGGLLLLPLRRMFASMAISAGAAAGLLLFGVAFLTSGAGRSALSGLGDRGPLILGLAALAFVLYGVATDRLVTRWKVKS